MPVTRGRKVEIPEDVLPRSRRGSGRAVGESSNLSPPQPHPQSGVKRSASRGGPGSPVIQVGSPPPPLGTKRRRLSPRRGGAEEEVGVGVSGVVMIEEAVEIEHAETQPNGADVAPRLDEEGGLGEDGEGPDAGPPVLDAEAGPTEPVAELGSDDPAANLTTILIQDDFGGQQAIQLDAATAAKYGIDLEGALATGEGGVAEISEEGIARLMQATQDGTLIAETLEPSAPLAPQPPAPTVDPSQPPPGLPKDLRTVEFNFLDNKNICCGLCGEIVPYEQLMSEHLPSIHPEILGDGGGGEGGVTMEEMPYEEWLREKLRVEKRAIESGFKLTSYESPARVHRSSNRPQRRVSQIRVNPTEMTLTALDQALKKKMVEKMGRKVPVTLVDKQHARCGLCNAVVSLNRKFEIVHLVRHFNAWHPSQHKCAGSWLQRAPAKGGLKPLSMHDFAVIDANSATPDNLQCIWCGMFMDADSLAMHFDEVHPDEIEVPKCNLCLQELVVNARMQEKYGQDLEITLPDEHHLQCGRFGAAFGSEAALERGIERRLQRGGMDALDLPLDEEEEEEEMSAAGGGGLGAADDAEMGPEAYLNSRMSLGKRKKPKRQFIMPALRQAAPMDSEFVEPVTECHWRCKRCQADILAAVISAGAIKHYRTNHPEHLDNMQYELCKARLERVSDGCMEFVHPTLIECLLCNMTYNLHKPYNMCRAIRHLKSKHPNLMPEYAGVSDGPQAAGGSGAGKPSREVLEAARLGRKGEEGGSGEGVLEMVESLEALKETYGIDMSKVVEVGGEGADGDQVYVLMPEGEELDAETAAQLVASANGLEQQPSSSAASNSASNTRVFTLAMPEEKKSAEPRTRRQTSHSATAAANDAEFPDQIMDESAAGS